MKIIKINGEDGCFIKVQDLLEAIDKHGDLVRGNHAWSDRMLEEAYITAHRHIRYMIEGEVKAQKEVYSLYAGDSNNSNNLCNIGDDHLDKQREIKVIVQVGGDTWDEITLQASDPKQV